MNELTKTLKPEFIYLQKEAKSDTQILSDLADQLFEKGIVKECFKEAVLQREREFPTGLPTEGVGVAIPHAEAKFVNEDQVAIAILKNPVSFQMMGMPENQVDISIVFMLALKGAENHLEMLKELMGLIQNPQFLKDMTQTTSKEEVIEMIQILAGTEGKQ